MTQPQLQLPAQMPPAHLLASGFCQTYQSCSFQIHCPCHFAQNDRAVVKIFCAAKPDFHLTARDDGLVALAPANDSDPHQQWIKDDAWGKLVEDEARFPAFALINRASFQALKHGNAENEQVGLSPYKIDDSLLWTLSGDVGNGYRCIRSASNIRLNLDAQNWNKNKMILFSFNKQPNQKWKIAPAGSHQNHVSACKQLAFVRGDTTIIRLCCEARPDFFLTVRSDAVVLAPRDDHDFRQQWIKDDSWGADFKDEAGFPAFALVNKATNKALIHGNAEWDKVKVSPYIENEMKETILWTKSADVGHGYHCIRSFSNICLNLDAKQADPKEKGIKDGNELIVFRFNNQKNQKWKTTVCENI